MHLASLPKAIILFVLMVIVVPIAVLMSLLAAVLGHPWRETEEV